MFHSDPRLLLHSSPPEAIYTITPKTVLGSKWWHEQLLEAVAKQNNQCYTCGVHANHVGHSLEPHEYYNINYNNGRVKLEKVVALCIHCHDYIHDGRVFYNQANYNSSKNVRWTTKYYEEVIQKGEALISDYIQHEPSILNRELFKGWKKAHCKTPPLWELYPLLVIPGVPMYEKNSFIRYPRWSDWHLSIKGYEPVYSPFKTRGEWLESKRQSRPTH